jgi:hypothetical protein
VTHTLQQLRGLLDRHFNDEDLRHLCFDLGVDYDNLGGRGKAANGRELIALLERQRQLPRLLARLLALRPAVARPDPPPAPDLTAVDARQEQAQQLFNQARPPLFPISGGVTNGNRC